MRGFFMKNQNWDVFINCPFDSHYVGLLHAITFTVCYLGFVPRSALETKDSGQVRLMKIVQIIKDSRLSIHDISRVEPVDPATSILPRFNMPFECGLFFGAKNFAPKRMREEKCALILDSEPYRYQKTMSDINGNDIESHDNNPEKAIEKVRHFLSGNVPDKDRAPLPGEGHVISEYKAFLNDLPGIVGQLKISEDEIRQLEKWKEFVYVVDYWATRRAKA